MDSKPNPPLDKILDEDDPDLTSEESESSNEGQQEIPKAEEDQGKPELISEAPKVQFKKVSHKVPSPLRLHVKFLIGNQVFEVYDVKNKQRYYIRRIGIVEEG